MLLREKPPQWRRWRRQRRRLIDRRGEKAGRINSVRAARGMLKLVRRREKVREGGKSVGDAFFMEGEKTRRGFWVLI